MIEKAKTASARVIDELGRVVLLAEARKALNWGEGTAVEIWVNATDNEIVMKQHVRGCIYCGETYNLQEYRKKQICMDCKEAIAGL